MVDRELGQDRSSLRNVNPHRRHADQGLPRLTLIFGLRIIALVLNGRIVRDTHDDIEIYELRPRDSRSRKYQIFKLVAIGRRYGARVLLKSV